MLRIRLKSKVKGKKDFVFGEFNQKLFMHLLPPGAKLLKFDGSTKGDIVHLKFGFPFFAQWVSEIVEDQKNEETSYFIDEGRKLPFGLRKWRHIHKVHKSGEDNSMIEDDMSFSTGLMVFDVLLYPLLYLAFLPRVLQYKVYFGRPKK